MRSRWEWGLEFGYVEVTSPVTRRKLSRVPPGVERVQFSTPLTDEDHRALGSWFEEHPGVHLRAYGQEALGAGGDLSFLRHYPVLGGLSVDCLYDPPVLGPRSLDLLPTSLRELDLEVRTSDDALRRLADLPGLHRLSLAHHRRLPPVLSELTSLRELHLTGPVKDLGPLAGLTQLEQLKLRSVTADLAPLVTMTQLRALEIRLGGTTDLSVVPSIGMITYLELWLVRGLADLGFLADMHHLQHLFLQALRNVRALPDLSRCTALERVWLETMKGLVDLSALATAPALRQLDLVDVGHLQPEDLLPLTACPALQELGVGLGSDGRNLAARDLLRIPGSYGGHTWPITRPAGPGDGGRAGRP